MTRSRSPRMASQTSKPPSKPLHPRSSRHFAVCASPPAVSARVAAMLAFAIILVYDTFPKMSTSKIPFIDNSILQPKRLQATAKISAMLHAAVDVALHIPLGNILALIVMLLAARRSVLDLRRLVPCLYASPVRPVRGAKRYARTRPLREERRVLTIHL